MPNDTAKNLGDYNSLGRGSFASKYRALAAATGFKPDAKIFGRLGAFTSQVTNWGGGGSVMWRGTSEAKSFPSKNTRHQRLEFMTFRID